MQRVLKKDLSKQDISKRIPFGFMFRARPLSAVSLKSSDEDLMCAFKRGDKQAFEILLSRHKKPLFNYVYKYLRQTEASEEAFQEILLRIIKSSEDYKTSAKFTTWLYTVARNYCIDQIRKGKYRQHASLEQKNDGLEEDGSDLHEKLADPGPGADTHFSAHQLEKHLMKALSVMPEDQKEVFILREYQSLKFEEIATMTKSSVNTVKSRMRYALRFLQKKFAEIGVVKEVSEVNDELP